MSGFETVVVMMMFAVLGGWIAKIKHRNPLGWGLLCGLFPVSFVVLCFMKYKPDSSALLLCPHCGHKGRPVVEKKGHIALEVVLWLAGIIPGLLYSAWRYSTRIVVCPTCSAPNMIPLDSPRAKQMLQTEG